MSDIERAAQDIADKLGVKMDSGSTIALPDGSGCFTASMPLSQTHWIYGDGFNVPPMGMRMRHDDRRYPAFRKAAQDAARYAVRCATMNGTAMDFDPDALVQSMLVGLFGYHTEDGLSSDAWANPDPVPVSLIPPLKDAP